MGRALLSPFLKIVKRSIRGDSVNERLIRYTFVTGESYAGTVQTGSLVPILEGSTGKHQKPQVASHISKVTRHQKHALRPLYRQ